MLSWADDYNLPPAKTTERVNLLAEFKPGMRGVFPPEVSASAFATRYQDGKSHTIRPGGAQLLAQGQPTLAWIAGPPDAFTAKGHNFRAGQTLRKQAALVNDTRVPLDYEVAWTVNLGGKPVVNGDLKGTIPAGRASSCRSKRPCPLRKIPPSRKASSRWNAKVGTTTHQDRFTFQVFPTEAKSPPLKTPVLIADSSGKTSAWLASLGVKTLPWDGEAAPGAVLVIGRQTLSGTAGNRPKLSALEDFVTAGGRLLVMSQDADWIRENTGFRVTRHSTRRMWPVQAAHPLMAGVPVSALRDWAGGSTLQEARPAYPLNEFPPHGWRWGQRGVLGAAASKNRISPVGGRFLKASSTCNTRRSWNSISAKAGSPGAR